MAYSQTIEDEIKDLDGLLCDLYRRVANGAPALGHEIALALAANARSFEQLVGTRHG